MGKVYTRRERVETALNHREPDRVPCDMTIAPPAYIELCEYPQPLLVRRGSGKAGY